MKASGFVGISLCQEAGFEERSVLGLSSDNTRPIGKIEKNESRWRLRGASVEKRDGRREVDLRFFCLSDGD